MRITLAPGAMATLALTLLVPGCKKESGVTADPASKAPPTELSALWRLAPADMKAGVVARAGALDSLAHGLELVRASYEKVPGADRILRAIEAETANPLGVSPLHPTSWRSIGLDLGRPAAGFFLEGQAVLVVPVGDRDLFTEKLEGTSEGEGDQRIDRFEGTHCKAHEGHYVCVTEEGLFARLGSNAAVIAREAERPRELRGDLEVHVDVPESAPAFAGLLAAVLLDRGALTVRAHIRADTTQVAPYVAATSGPLARSLSEAPPAGFLRLGADLSKVLDRVPAEPTPFGVTARDLVAALTGEVVVRVPAVTPTRGTAQIGLAKPEVIKPIVLQLCPAIAQGVPGASARVDGERCLGTLVPPPTPELAHLPFARTPIPFAVSFDAASMIVDFGETSSAPGTAKVPYTRAGTELLSGDWPLAMWGVGLVPALSLPSNIVPEGEQRDALRAGTWLLLHVRELGYGLRTREGGVEVLLRIGTQWSNPDEVLAKLTPVLAAAADGKDVSAELAAIAQAHPSSPLAAAHQVGEAGLLPGVTLIGVTAAVAIPSFVEYTTASRALQDEMMLQEKLREEELRRDEAIEELTKELREGGAER